jgi:hypothetical protein
MKTRPDGFLAHLYGDFNCYEPDTEVGDYIAELHDYLWRVVRAVRPGASGTIDDYLDDVVEQLEGERAQ